MENSIEEIKKRLEKLTLDATLESYGSKIQTLSKIEELKKGPSRNDRKEVSTK